MNLKKLAALALALILVLALPLGALADKIDADDLDFEEIIEDTEAEGLINVYHWWTAGGEKNAIESVVMDTYLNLAVGACQFLVPPHRRMVFRPAYDDDLLRRSAFFCYRDIR